MTIPIDSDAPAAALLRKLDHHVRLTADERDALNRLLGRSVRSVAARTAIIADGDAPAEIAVLVEGWAARTAALPDGRRRITGLCLPGDIADFDALVMQAFDGTLEALTPVRVAALNYAALNELSRERPRVARALWWESLMTAALQRGWTVNVGKRSAHERLACLFAELHLRARLVGLVEDGTFALPLTQADLGDACGLTAVHTNRALQAMRADGLVVFADGRLTLPDPAALASVGGFDATRLPIAALRRPRAVTAAPLEVLAEG